MSNNNKQKLGYLIPVILTILLILAVQRLNIMTAYPTSALAFVDTSLSNSGQELFNFLWQYRGADFEIQAFLLFTAAVGCIALLRKESEK
jgi:hypothetical protein